MLLDLASISQLLTLKEVQGLQSISINDEYEYINYG